MLSKRVQNSVRVLRGPAPHFVPPTPRSRWSQKEETVAPSRAMFPASAPEKSAFTSSAGNSQPLAFLLILFFAFPSFRGQKEIYSGSRRWLDVLI